MLCYGLSDTNEEKTYCCKGRCVLVTTPFRLTSICGPCWSCSEHAGEITVLICFFCLFGCYRGLRTTDNSDSSRGGDREVRPRIHHHRATDIRSGRELRVEDHGGQCEVDLVELWDHRHWVWHARLPECLHREQRALEELLIRKHKGHAESCWKHRHREVGEFRAKKPLPRRNRIPFDLHFGLED